MTNEIKETIQNSAMSGYQMIIITICLVINMLDGFDVLVMAFTASSVAKEWGLEGAQLGVLLSAGLFGMAGGSMFVAPWADKFGRRQLIITCLLIISLGMLLSSVSQSFLQLACCRVFTGLGIGGMLASLNVIVAEYTSNKWRYFALSLLQTGYPVGAVIGGSIAAVLIGLYGWRSVFLFGALASILMIPLVFWRLPESLEFLLVKKPVNALRRINYLLAMMKHSPIASLPEVDTNLISKQSGFANLFTGNLGRTTILVWLSFFMVMFSFYFVLSWTPKLLVAAGLSAKEGISAGVIINLGGVAGGLMLGYIASRLPLKFIIGFYMIATSIFMMAFGLIPSGLTLALILGVLIGFFLFGSMIGMYALVPDLYPASVRATGMGWAIGIGRVGAILSPVFAGLLLDNSWQGTTLFLVFALPLIISMFTVSVIKSGLPIKSVA